MSNDLREKKVEQIANFIVNNITLAEVSSMMIERATETAEFIVNNELDPNNFSSPVARKKLAKKIKIFKGKVEEAKKESWLNNVINKIGLGKRKEEKEEPPHKGFTTKKNK
jgi:hypothetical protein